MWAKSLVAINIFLWYLILAQESDPKGKPNAGPNQEKGSEAYDPEVAKRFIPADCKKFINNTSLDVINLVGIDWKVFFIWNSFMDEIVHVSFSIPSKSLIDRFKIELDKHITPPLNWSNCAVVMECNNEVMLFMRTNETGMYLVLPSVMMENPQMPKVVFAIKLVEPKYMSFLNCNHSIAFGLAPSNNMPTREEVNDAVKLIGYQNENNCSYFDLETPKVPEDYDFQAEDDVIMDVEPEYATIV